MVLQVIARNRGMSTVPTWLDWGVCLQCSLHREESLRSISIGQFGIISSIEDPAVSSFGQAYDATAY